MGGDAVSTSFLIWARNGQPAMVSLTAMRHVAVGGDVTAVTMPRSTMLPPSSGSITPRSRPVTSSTVGGDGVGAGHPRILPVGAV